MRRLEQRDLEDLVVFAAGFLCGFYFMVLVIQIARLLFKGEINSIDICLIDLTMQEITRIPRSARTIAKIIYDILNRMK